MITRMPMARRPGLTLTEALVAMFVAALGMISLLTLFPLGALQMGQALKDSRTAEAARQSDSLMRNYWRDALEKGNDPGLFTCMNSPPTGTPAHPIVSVAIDPTVSASYPVFLDPIGDFSQTGTANSWVTGVNQPGLPRRNLINTVIPQQRLRFCTLLDDLTYDQTGTGAPTASVPVERGGRYNWLAIVQRPARSSDNLANMTILVFDGRAFGYAIPNGEAVFTPTILNGSGLSFVYPTGARPPVSKGRWIALHTLIEATVTVPTKTNVLQFYRVVSANDEVPGTLDIELQTPIRADQLNLGTTRVIVFTGLSEVFERPQLNGK